MIDVITQAKGLVRQYNPLSTAPGALSKAENCVIRRENIIEPRRGYKYLGTNPQGAPFESAFNFNGYALHSDGQRLYRWNGTLLSRMYTTSTFGPNTDHRIRGVEVNQNCYLNTSQGVKAVDGVITTSGYSRDAGAPRALDASYTLTSGASGFLGAGFQVAYRAVIKRADYNQNILFGYPSQRLWVINGTGAGENVNLEWTLPNDIEEGDVVQIYRTTQVSGTTSDASGDEMGLVYEYTVTSTDVTNGSMTFTDSITDSLIGATLYTSPSEQGIAQANARPPRARDMALYKSNYMFYGHTDTPYQLSFSVVGTAGLTGNTLTIAGTTYNFGATEIVSGGGSPQVKVSATGVAAVDIDDTARSLVRVINRYAGNTSVYAYYLSGPDDLPGQILLQEQSLSGAGAFTILASNSTIAAMTFPEAPVGSPSTAMTANNEERKNGLFYSKTQQPEAVPLLNYLLVGPANKKILRLAPLRDSLIIISEAGIFRLTGEDPQSFTITTLDDTIKCKAIETVQVLSNQVIMLTNQGVVRVSENGVEVISREIEIEISKVLNISGYEGHTTGVVYESERSYLLSTVSDTDDSDPTVTYVYNLFTRTWTKWTFGINGGVVEENTDRLQFAQGGNELYEERKDLANTDYADPEKSVTINSVSGSTVTITGASPSPGWVLSQGSLYLDILSIEIDGVNQILTFAQDVEGLWSAGAATLYPSVEMDIEYMTWSAKNPGLLKQVRSVGLLTDDTENENTATAVDFTFMSNFDRELESVTIRKPERGWGAAWGSFAWGGGGDSFGYPTYVPRNKQYCNRFYLGFRHKTAWEKVAIAGAVFEFEMVSEEVGQ